MPYEASSMNHEVHRAAGHESLREIDAIVDRLLMSDAALSVSDARAIRDHAFDAFARGERSGWWNCVEAYREDREAV